MLQDINGNLTPLARLIRVYLILCVFAGEIIWRAHNIDPSKLTDFNPY